MLPGGEAARIGSAWYSSPVKVAWWNTWSLFRKSEDLPGVWVGHCLGLDVVSQGDSLEDAVQNLLEAIRLVVVDDCSRGVDPRQRPTAPEEDWTLLFSTLRTGKSLEELNAEERDDRRTVIAAQMRICIPEEPACEESAEVLPPAWQIAAFERITASPTSSPHS